MIHVEITDPPSDRPIDTARITSAVEMILSDGNIRNAEVSVAVVDDATIHALNRRHLDHDYATDVLSFLIEHETDRLEGEVVLSADTAAANAARYGWSADDEMLLYVIHGTLHLLGFDDHEPQQQARMREKERHYLAHFGLKPRYDEAPRQDATTGRTDVT